MATEFKLPELGENVYEGTIVRLLVKVGDTVAKDQNVLEIETGKASVELPTPVGGKILSINVKEGEKAKVGQTVMTFDSSVAVPAAAPKKEAPKAAAPAAAPAPATPAPAPAAKPAAVAPPPQPIVVAQSTGSVPASPSTRQFAREVGIDVTQVPGSGPGGRVSTDDVKSFARAANAGLVRGAGKPATPPLPDFARWGETEREPMNNIRIATSDHMTLAWTTIPHVTIFDSADITELEKLRDQYKKKGEALGIKLTLTAFLMKIVASALKNAPKINASLDLQNKQLVYKKYVNVGVAVDTDRGLLVPVIRDADKKNVLQIAQELNRISERAKARKISPEDMQGGSFTITNIGGIGGKYFTPIINWPEVAILGIGRGSIEAVSINGFFHPRQMLPLSLSFDHRIIDGADGARFLRWIVDAIQSPAMLAVEG
jgi:pyruvate dehydrogenase E2 component (dihydrolipoamide acetyltransferase)